MKIDREFAKEPVSCDECERSIKTSFTVRGQHGDVSTGILLCQHCLKKMQSGTIKIEMPEVAEIR